MTVEFLENGSSDCPLIRIFGGQPEVCRQFRRAFEQLAEGGIGEISLTDLPGVEPIGGCRLVAQAGSRDKGIVRKGGNEFCWVLTPGTWNNVLDLIGPFCRAEAVGFQWLDQVPSSEARVLVSASSSGTW